jgi:hypothetical protein
MSQEREAPTLAYYAAILAGRWGGVVFTAFVLLLFGASC